MPITSQPGNYSVDLVPGVPRLALGPNSVQNSATLTNGHAWEIYASGDTTTPIASSSAPNGWGVDLDSRYVSAPVGAAFLNRFDFYGGPMYVLVTNRFEVVGGVNSRISANIGLVPPAPVVQAVAVAANGDYLLTVQTFAAPNITETRIVGGAGGAAIASGLAPGGTHTVAVPRAYDGPFTIGQMAVVPSATIQPEMRSGDTTVNPPARFPSISGLHGLSTAYEHNPRFGWTFNDPEAGDYQTAWQMVFTQNGAQVYDSGWIASGAGSGTSPSPLAPGTYTLALRVRDSHGLTSNPATLTFTQLASVPRVVNISLPGGSPTIDRTPVFSWGYQDDAGDPQASWRLIVQRVSDGAFVHDTGTVAGTANTHEVSTPLVAGIPYRAIIHVSDNTGALSDAATYGFMIVESAPVVTVTAVTGDGPNPTYDQTPTVTWSYSEANGDAQASFRVVVRRRSDNGVAYDSGVLVGAATSHLLGTLAPDAYAVQVTATDAAGVSGTSAAFNFSVLDARPVLSGFSRTSPDSDTTPVFAWTYTDPLGVAQGWFRLRILSGATVIHDSGQVANSATRSYEVTPALFRGRPYTAELTVDRGREAATLTFTLPNALPVASALALTGSTAGAGALRITTDTTPAFTWTFSDANGEAQHSYNLQVLARMRGEILHNSGVVVSSSGAHTVTTVLEDDDEYRATLVVYDPNGDGSTPISLDFDIPFDQTRVILACVWQAPPHNTSVVPSPFFLFRVPGVAGGPRLLEFELQADNDLNFSSPITFAKTRRSRVGWGFSSDGGATWGALPARLPEGNPGGAAGRWLRFQPTTPLPLGNVHVRARALVM